MKQRNETEEMGKRNEVVKEMERKRWESKQDDKKRTK
jgi:hypothetical protein